MFGIFKRKANISTAEALGLLGLAPNANEIDIKKAYISKMRIHHPDLGGNEYLAAQINWARDVLLKIQ